MQDGKAIESFSKTVEFKPDYADAYSSRGWLYSRIKQYDKAIQDYTKAIELKPDYLLVYFNRAFAYIKMRQYENGIKDCSKALELKPGDVNTYRMRANAYVKLKQYDKAIQDYLKVIELNPDYANAYNCLGWLYNKTKQYDNAIQNYSKLLELKPNHNVAFLNIMELCTITTRPEQFNQWLKRFEAAIPEAKLSKEDLIPKLYLICVNKSILNEPRQDIENRLDALLKEKVKLNWSFDMTDEWLDNPKNGLTPEQVKYIRGLTDKIKTTQKN
jgi:tetratricopeptide (TPR) repeat protein